MESIWGYETSQEWVKEYFLDQLNSRLKWTARRDGATSYLERFFEDIGGSERPSEFIDEVMTEIDPVVCMINDFVEDLVGDLEWWVWVPHCRQDYIILKPCDDYRAMVYNDRVEDGTLSPDQETKVCIDELSWIAMI